MKFYNLEHVKPGMILAEPVINQHTMIELLTTGTELTAENIKLLRRLDIYIVAIQEDEAENTTSELDLAKIKEAALEAGEEIDLDSLKENLNEIEDLEINNAQVFKSIVNNQMEIHVLTGDGDIPIDEKHEELVNTTRNEFERIRKEGEIDLDAIRRQVQVALPDMIRNNDVLMRLNQLKETDDYTFNHSLRVSILATMVGKWMGFDRKELEEIAQAGLLFDVGKLKIPEYILKKHEEYTTDEYELIKRHPQFGYGVLLKTKGISKTIKYAALHHHERLDGSGYPFRIRESQIHPHAKIIMVCDVFDALISDKPYKKKMSSVLAADYINWSSGKLFDSTVCYVLLKNISEFFKGKQVLLSTGEVGRVVYVDVNFPTRPLIQVGHRFIDLVKERNINIVDIGLDIEQELQ